MSDIHAYAPLWGSWHIESLIGEGSFGKVYKVRKEEFGKTYYSAVKIISIPQNEADLRHMRNEGLDEVSVKSYFQAFVSDILQEIDLMSQLRGNSNIVSFEDHKVIERTDGFGWDILIRMELLQSLSEKCMEQPMDEAEVIKLGIHICRALELCARTKTIHRDIKPDNIFVSAYGDYKLGDFGIARQIERTMTGLSKKGTYTYMAPEVFKGDEYGASVDFYSLGIVMYRLLNKNRTPFLPSFPAPIMPADRDASLQRRMKGEVLPAISGVSDSLNAIILRACAFDRTARFVTATEMREVLEAYVAGKSAVVAVPVPVVIAAPETESESEKTEATIGTFDALPQEKTELTVGAFGGVPQQPVQPDIATDQSSQKKNRAVWAVVILLAVVLLAVLANSLADKTRGNSPETEPLVTGPWATNTTTKSTTTSQMTAAPVENLHSIIGAWSGTCTPEGPGETALKFAIYSDGSQVFAFIEFDNLPGRSNTSYGSFVSEVTYNNQKEQYTFTSKYWVHQPSGFLADSYVGTVANDTFTGTGTGGYPMQLSRTSSADTKPVMTTSSTTTTTTEPKQNYVIGSTVRFGPYDWRVLDVQNSKALLITKDIVELRPFNLEYTDVKWESCTLRRYLNGEFYNKFNVAEQARIIETKNSNKDNQWSGTDGGNSTMDKVFLLSIEEVVKYFGDSGQLQNRSFENSYIEDTYNGARMAKYKGKTEWWWLRSPGILQTYAVAVNGDGFLDLAGNGAGNNGGGVRPALWISIN